MRVGNSNFDKKFDELCKLEQQEKERKKKIFHDNIKNKTVVLDDYGNVIPNTKKQTNDLKTDSNKNTIYILIGFAIAVYLIVTLSNMIY